MSSNTTDRPRSDTTPAPRRAAGSATGVRGLRTLTRTEFRLFGRDPGSVFFALAFPTVLMIGMGSVIPGMDEVITDIPAPWDGLQVIHMFAPAIVATAIGTASLTVLPVYLATYREKGILRRLSTTPMRPQGVLFAHVTISLVSQLVASVLAVGAGAAILGVPIPANLALTLLAFALGAAAMLGVGLIIGGLAPRGSTASGIGMLVYFPMLFFAGLWTPGPMMPDLLATISSYTPLGAVSQAMTQAWFTGDFPALQLVVLSVYAVGLFTVATRVFRWA